MNLQDFLAQAAELAAIDDGTADIGAIASRPVFIGEPGAAQFCVPSGVRAFLGNDAMMRRYEEWWEATVDSMVSEPMLEPPPPPVPVSTPEPVEPESAPSRNPFRRWLGR